MEGKAGLENNNTDEPFKTSHPRPYSRLLVNNTCGTMRRAVPKTQSEFKQMTAVCKQVQNTLI